MQHRSRATRARAPDINVAPSKISAALHPKADGSGAENPRRYLPDGSGARKRVPVTSGLLDYFPDACAAVAEISWLGNEKHNPGQPLHHARGKSSDHADCVARHLMQRGGFEFITIGGVQYKLRHTAELAWRAFALLQEELETELSLTLPRGATEPGVELKQAA